MNLIFIYGSPLYRANVDAAMKSGFFKGKKQFANLLRITAQNTKVDWFETQLASAFSWQSTPVRWNVWDKINSLR